MTNTTIQQIAARISVPRECPNIVLAVGPCRSNTTVQLRVFANAGIPAYYQVPKAIYRSLGKGDDLQFAVPDAGNVPTIFMKETVGPYTEDESTIDPLRILLESGVPPEKLHVMTMLREPLATLTSWMQVSRSVEQYFSHAEAETLARNIAVSCRTVSGIAQEAREFGIPQTTFVQEALRDNEPAAVMGSVFQRIGLPYIPTIVSDWEGLPPMGSPESNITFYPPGSAPYQDEGSRIIHSRIERSSGLRYYRKSPEDIDANITAGHVAILRDEGTLMLYDQSRRQSEHDLGLYISPSIEAEQFRRRHGIIDGEMSHFRISGERSR